MIGFVRRRHEVILAVHPYLVSVEALPPDGETFSLEFQPAEVDEEFRRSGLREVEALGPLRAQVTLVPSDGEVLLVGQVSMGVRYNCVRCLEPFEDGLRERFQVTLSTRANAPADPEIRSGNLEIEILRGSEVDLTELVTEQMYLALRPHPVCRAACRGLCPSCGADLNKSPCRCDGGTVDSRFAVLEKWARKG
jgi:uncharacterized protein